MRRDIGYDVAGFDSATWVRPGSVNAQGQFVRDRMSEPYELGRPKIKPWKRNKKRKEKKGKGTKEEAACSTFVRQAHSFFLFGMSLPFSPRPLVRERRMNVTMLVRLFQDSPSQFAYLRITTKPSTDRLPRRTGFRVIFKVISS